MGGAGEEVGGDSAGEFPAPVNVETPQAGEVKVSVCSSSVAGSLTFLDPLATNQQ